MDKRFKLLIMGLLILMAFVGVVSAARTLTLIPDNQVDCSNYVEFKLDTGQFQVPIADGEYCTNDGRCVTIDFYAVNGLGTKIGETNPYNAFDFKDANFDIYEVIVHGGKLGCNVYSYSPAVRADTFLTAPFNDKGDDKPENDVYPDLSYIKFCGPAPEFPTLALPLAMLVGVVGVVYVVRKREY